MFRVRWERQALNELTDAWMQGTSTQRRAVTTASHAVDLRVGSNPLTEGESRPKGRRITFISPLVVIFRVESDRETVSVIHVRMYKKRK